MKLFPWLTNSRQSLRGSGYSTWYFSLFYIPHFTIRHPVKHLRMEHVASWSCPKSCKLPNFEKRFSCISTVRYASNGCLRFCLISFYYLISLQCFFLSFSTLPREYVSVDFASVVCCMRFLWGRCVENVCKQQSVWAQTQTLSTSAGVLKCKSEKVEGKSSRFTAARIKIVVWEPHSRFDTHHPWLRIRK